jgi:hypothetical protein
MKQQIYSIHDSKAEAFLPPFFLNNKHLAIRAFTDGINDPNTSLYKHPEDYSLFHLGEFDDDTGSIVPITPVNVTIGMAVATPRQQTEMPLTEE